MTLKKRFQIFVSSTFVDLRAERDEIANAIQGMGHIPAGMELFGSDAEDSWTVIERTIEFSDYFVLVLAGRYGSLSETGVSFTEREFECAKMKGIPILAFVHEDTDELPAGSVDKTVKLQRLLKSFRKKVTADHQVSYWNSKTDLSTKVVASLSRTMLTTPRPGWIRGDIESEIKSLQMVRSNLQERVRHLESEIRSKNAIIDAAHRRPELEGVLKASASIPVTLKHKYKEHEHYYEASVDIPSLGAWLFAFQMRVLSAHTFALAVFLTALKNPSNAVAYRHPCHLDSEWQLDSVLHYFSKYDAIPEATLAEIAITAVASGLMVANATTKESFKEYWAAWPHGKTPVEVFARINDTCWSNCARYYSNLPPESRPPLHPKASQHWERWAADKLETR